MSGWNRLLAAVVLAAVGGFPSVGPAGGADLPAAPFWGAAVEGHPVTAERMGALASEMGFSPEVVVFFLQWPAPGTAGEFPRVTLEAIRERGAVPCITWEPFYLQDGKEVPVRSGELLAGAWDGYIRRFAEACAAWRRPVIFRFAHEMNIARYHWGTEEEAYGPDSPGIYREMFRYVVRAFRDAGADNALWAFCPNAENVPDESWDPSAGWNRAEAYYPGDAYVDLLGVDGYNWGTTRTVDEHGWQSRWRSFADVFAAMRRTLQELAPQSPLMVFETASADAGGSKPRWVEEMVSTARDWALLGVVWFQVDKEVDWRIRSGGGPAVRIPAQRAPADASAREWFAAFLERRRCERK